MTLLLIRGATAAGCPAEQKGRHDGGSKWIGTGGTSPVGHSGHHPGGMRVGGESRNKSAVQVAAERRYRAYGTDRPLTSDTIYS